MSDLENSVKNVGFIIVFYDTSGIYKTLKVLSYLLDL